MARGSLPHLPVHWFKVGGVLINPVAPHPGQLAHQRLFDHRAKHLVTVRAWPVVAQVAGMVVTGRPNSAWAKCMRRWSLLPIPF